MKLSNRIISIASAVVLSCSVLSFHASAYSNKSSGTEKSLNIYGTSSTIVCLNNKGSYYTCDVEVKEMGSGKGNITAYCQRGTVKTYSKTFKDKGTKTMFTSTDALSSKCWSIDLQNSKLSAKRTGAEVRWEFG